LLGGEEQEAENRAPDLEGAGQLLGLELQRNGHAGCLREHGRFLDGGAPNAAFQSAARLEDHRDVERHGRYSIVGSPRRRAILPRTRSASAAASGAAPSVAIGGRTATVDAVGENTRECLGSAVSVPEIASGTTSTASSIARRNAPSRKGASEPSTLRVPSGKTTTEAPAWSRPRICSRAARPLSLCAPESAVA